MDFRIIIPARFDATRLPGKVLMDINGKSMLQHVYERAVSTEPESVVIATCDDVIAQAAEEFGATVVMTADDHLSGTERISEAVDTLDYDDDEIIIGLQADEPLVSYQAIRLLAEELDQYDNVKVASLCQKITDPHDLFNSDIVKVILNRRGNAIYFSRAPIPWGQASFSIPAKAAVSECHFRHIGMYGYRAGFLKDYMNWQTSPLESLESLEQLRILWNGGRIHMRQVEVAVPAGVDTQADLERVRKLIMQEA